MAKKSRTREAKQRRQKEQRQNRQRTILVGIVIVAILAIALIVTSNQPVETYIPPNIADKYDGLSYSLSVEGYPRIGDPDAPVSVQEFASFSCPGCEAFHSSSFDAILERVKLGQVLFTYVPLQTGSIPNAGGAARTALCAGQQGMFWEMHDVLFEWHTLYGNTAFSQNRLLSGVDAMGMNGGTLTSCFNSQSITNVLNAAQTEGVTSTPTIYVNGVPVNTGESGGVPTAQEILTDIDVKTPNDWRPTVDDVDESETDEDTEEIEATEEPTVEIEATEEPIVEDEATEEPDADAEDSTDTDADETTEDDESSEDESDAEATEEADD